MADLESKSELQSTRSVRPADDQKQAEFKVLPPELRPMPESVGRFRPLLRLGKGGGGTVYLAEDPVLGRQVAVKVPKVDGSLSNFPFLAEARAAAKLKHPNVVQIFDVGSLDDGSLFIAMEVVNGGSLAARLKRGPLNWMEASEIVAQISGAIDFAHQHKLLHRDLKPSNVLLDEHETAKVADFGLSMSTDDAHLSDSSITGTPAYMSPEQASGQIDHLTPKTDLWSIGVILYESLTGKRPFAAPSWLALQYQILHDEPESPRSIDPRIPRSVEAICFKCLEKKPEDRPASASEIAEQLRKAISHEQGRRRRVSLAAAVALVGIGMSTWILRTPQPSAAPQKSNSIASLPVPEINRKWPADQQPLIPVKGQVDLLAIAPEEWDFDRTKPLSTLSIRPESREFTVASSSASFFAWPVKLPRRFKWESRFNYSEDGGQFTLAWSVHPEMLQNELAGYLSDAVHLQRFKNRLIPSVGRDAWVGRFPGRVTQTTPAVPVMQQLRPLDANASGEVIDVDFTVHDGVLQSLVVNHVRVALQHLKIAAFDPAPEIAQPAIFIHGGRLTVIESTITELPAAD